MRSMVRHAGISLLLGVMAWVFIIIGELRPIEALFVDFTVSYEDPKGSLPYFLTLIKLSGIFAIFAIIAGTLAMRGNGKKVQPKQMITAIALLGMTMSAPLLLASIFLLIIP